MLLVGQGAEEPDVVSRMLDLNICPGKPIYTLASEVTHHRPQT